MEKRGQGALEYLLLIGGAVLIAVIVIAVVTGLANPSTVNALGTCASKVTCDSCLRATAGTCKGLQSDRATLVVTSTGVATATCTGPQANVFAVCMPT